MFILLLIIVWGIVSIIDNTDSKKIEVDFTRKAIYGWYNGCILTSRDFYETSSIEEVLKLKKEVSDELDKKIEFYNKVK